MKTNSIANVGNDLFKQIQKSEASLDRATLLLSINRKIAALTGLNEILHCLIEETVTELNAERGSLFLNDPTTGELYSRVAQGELTREIRFLNTSGIAGAVYHSGIGEIIHDAHDDRRFNSSIDASTGFETRNIVCAPIRTVKQEVIGVIQILNKRKGRFTKADLETVSAITEQAAITLQNAEGNEKQAAARQKELQFLNINIQSEYIGLIMQTLMKSIKLE